MAKRKLPKTWKELDAITSQVYRDGYEMGSAHATAKAQHAVSAAKKERDDTRLRALAEITRFLSVAGQTVQAASRAMESEANQL